MNAIALKELRQIVRSKFVLSTLYVYLCVQFIVIFFSIFLPFYPFNIIDRVGSRVSLVIMLVCALFSICIIPFYTYMSAWKEKNGEMIDMLFLTSMTSWTIVRGKILSFILLTALLVTMTAALLSATYLLPGIDLFIIAQLMLYMFLTAVIVNSICLFCAFLFRNQKGRSITMIIIMLSIFAALILRFMAVFTFQQQVVFVGVPIVYVMHLLGFLSALLMFYIFTSIRVTPVTPYRKIAVPIGFACFIFLNLVSLITIIVCT